MNNDGVMRDDGKMLFTVNQWRELEMQTLIYKYLMASIPVPPQLLLHLSTKSNRGSVGLRFLNGSDPEPWRCRRTDGKKWRCSKNVAYDQKYCEHHARKTRPRSRKPGETQMYNIKDCPSMLSASSQQTEYSEWFIKTVGVPVHQSNNRFQQPMHLPIGGSKRDHIWKQDCSLSLSMQSGGNETEFDHESFQMAVRMLSGDRDGCEDVYRPLQPWLSQGSWACLGSGSGLTPGGPLGEAICLGIASTRMEPSLTTSSSCDDGGLSFVNQHDG